MFSPPTVFRYTALTRCRRPVICVMFPREARVSLTSLFTSGDLQEGSSRCLASPMPDSKESSLQRGGGGWTLRCLRKQTGA